MDINSKGSRHAKSTAGRVYYQYAIRDFYKLYSRRNFKKKVSKTAYTKFLLEFFAILFKEIVYNRWSFYIPNRLGFINLQSEVSNLKSMPSDKGNLQKGKRAVHVNSHSFRRIYSLKWTKKFVRFKNSKYYKFEPWKSKGAFEQYGTGTRAISKMIREAAEDPTKKLIA
jgi:hypothetical protein